MVSSMMPRWTAIWMTALLPLVLMATCAEAGRLSALATFRPVWLIASEVTAGRADLGLLVEPGAEVHEYALRPSGVRRIYEADLVILSGAGLEESLEGGLRQARRVVDASRGADLITTGLGVTDPHVWLDPAIAALMGNNIADAFALDDPSGAEDYARAADALHARLAALAAELREELEPLKGMTIITYHESFGYFCRAMGLRAHSLTGPSAETPRPERVRRAYDIVREEKLRAVFVESGAEGSPFMQKLRDDLGVEVCDLDTMTNEGRDYFGAMRYNAAQIARCLGKVR